MGFLMFERECLNRERLRECARKRNQTQKHKDYVKKYDKKRKSFKKRYNKRYRQEHQEEEDLEKKHFIISQKQSEYRNLGFVFSIDLENDLPDEPIDYHHVNSNLIYPIPSDLHKMFRGPDSELKHKFFCYQIIKQLYKNN
jgi:hypothetical protein